MAGLLEVQLVNVPVKWNGSVVNISVMVNISVVVNISVRVKVSVVVDVSAVINIPLVVSIFGTVIVSIMVNIPLMVNYLLHVRFYNRFENKDKYSLRKDGCQSTWKQKQKAFFFFYKG